MSSLSSKDRVSLCSFTFADGRRCRTPRIRNHPHFCAYHAEKEARARTTQKLGKDLDYFFSGDYLSACDLSTAMARLIPAVLRGDVKPRAARTVAYLMQTLLQSIHISQHEYGEAFGGDGWRKSIRNSVNGSHDYRFPPAPKSEQPAPAPQPDSTPVVNCHSERSEEPAFSSSSAAPPSDRPQPAAPPTQSSQSEIPTLSGPAPSPHTPLPPTSAEFVQRVMAGQTSGAPAPQVCHPERSGGSHPLPATSSSAPAAQPNNPPPTAPSTPPPGPNRDASWLNLDPYRRVRPDSHLL